MAYKALYRTYRPSTFEEVAGQQHIVRTIKNALASGKIAHAYLFTGPRGTGKTTMAKLLAKALNCDEGIGYQCNECENCIAINEGTHPDVIEIDAASNNGVEQVRDIIDKVKYGTILGRYKVYIIDEVHMMSAGAFNALLKTLEEPPEHVIFILATTEPHKILPTILSRCQRYDFTKVSDEDIKERMKEVLQREEITYNENAVDLIISLADGGMRDALSILDQVLAYSGDVLNEEDVLEIFSLESQEEKIELIRSIINGDVGDVLNRIKNYIDKGSDIKRLTSDLMDILKDLLIYINTRKKPLLSKLSSDQAMELAKKAKAKDVMTMIDILIEAIKNFKTVTNINPLFEITLLKLVNVIGVNQVEEPQIEDKKIVIEPETKQVDDDEKTMSPLEKALREQLTREAREKEKTLQQAPKIEEQPSLFDANESLPEIVLSKDLVLPKNATGDALFLLDDDTLIDIMVSSKKELKKKALDEWTNLKRLIVHPELGKAASLLLDSHPLVVSNKILLIECPLPNMVEKVNDKMLQENLQNAVASTFGNKMFVFAVSRNDSVRLQKKYTDLLVVGKLPKAKDVVIEFEGEE